MGTSEWFKVRGWNIERLLFALHRITGWGLTAFIVLHVLFVHQVTYGERAWNSLLSLDSTFLGRVVLLLVVVALIFHGLNGVRIMLIEFGYLLTEPKEQEYPYQVWLKNRRHRGYVLFMGILGIFLTIIAGVILL
jgi:succinate dehydrogenase, cytochrome b556 subunit